MLQLEKARLDLDRAAASLKFAADVRAFIVSFRSLIFVAQDKQELLAEKRRQFDKLETEKVEQISSLEAKMTELSSRLKGFIRIVCFCFPDDLQPNTRSLLRRCRRGIDSRRSLLGRARRKNRLLKCATRQ